MTKAKSVILTIMTITMLCLSAGTVYAGMNDVQYTNHLQPTAAVRADFEKFDRYAMYGDWDMVNAMIDDGRITRLPEDTEVYIEEAVSIELCKIRIKGTETCYWTRLMFLKGVLE